MLTRSERLREHICRAADVLRSGTNLVKLVLVVLAGTGLAVFSSGPSYVAADNTNYCLDCHSKMEGAFGDPAKLFAGDIHQARGFSCNDCHGGNPKEPNKELAKQGSTGYRGKPSAQDTIGLCGRCHSDAALMKQFNPAIRVDQVQEYATSVHGQKLKAGDTNVATCTSCHGVHGIKPPTDGLSPVNPKNVAETCAKCHANGGLMDNYKIKHDQYDKYKTSVHAKALYEKGDSSAPTCNDCHGNHGAAPPGIAAVANVCGQCHGRQASLFNESVHKPAFEKEEIGDCRRCHGNHAVLAPTDALLGSGPGSVCTTCHQGDRGLEVANQMYVKLTNLDNDIKDAEDLLTRAEHAGMEISKPRFELRSAVDALTQGRVVIHNSKLEALDEALLPGTEIAARSYQSGLEAFAELTYRRKGLFVSLIFIAFLAGLVILKIRQIEKSDPGIVEK